MRILQAAGLPDGVINLVYGPGSVIGDSGSRQPGPGRDPLHGLDAGLPGHVADRRREHRPLPLLPAPRRRDRRQGLHRRAPLRGRGRRRHRDPAGLVRVPGPEVLGRVARVPAEEPLGGRARATGRRGAAHSRRRRHRLRELHGRRDRFGASSARRSRQSTRRGRRERRSSPAAKWTTAKAGSSGPR